MSYIETFFYVAPNFECAKCWAVTPLPYPNLPATDHDQWNSGEHKGPTDSLPDGWTVFFGCRKCGHVEVYPADAVGEWLVQKQTKGVFHHEANCFSVGLQCAKVDCKSPATLHVNMGKAESGTELLSLLRSSFFHGSLPCGHQIMPIPEPFYRDIHRVHNSLW